MNREDKFNQIFDECLDRLFKGESIDHILAEYPDQARELEPLLLTAAATRAFSKVQPRADFKARARYEFMSAARELQEQPQRRSFFKWRWQSGWAIGLTAFLAVLMIGSGTIGASNNSMPGQALYPVKLATEQARLALTFSDVAKTELNAEYANRRSEEIEYLATAGNVEQIQKAASRLNVSLSNMSALAQEGNPVLNDTNASAEAPRAFTFNAVSIPPDNATQSLMAVPAANAKGIQPPAAETPTETAVPDNTGIGVPSIVNAPRGPAPQLAPGGSQDNAAGNNLTAESNSTGSVVVTQSNNWTAGNSNKLSKKDQIRKIIEENYQTRKIRLESALEKASPELKPAILQAIADSENEYYKAILNLDQGIYPNNNQNYIPQNNQSSNQK